MEEKIKKLLILIKRNKIILLIILLLLGLFYWYQIRPTIIYSECHRKSVKKAQESYKKENSWMVEQIKEGAYSIVIYENYYKSCLREKGINK